jgi:hypothetical protein
VIVLAWGCRVSHFLTVWWKRSTLPQVWGPGVHEGDAAVVEGDLQADAAVAAVAAGEDGTVVGEHAGRVGPSGGGTPELGVDVAGFEHVLGGAGQTQP